MTGIPTSSTLRRDVVADDLEVRDEQVVADRADRFLFPAAPAELCVVRGEVRVFGAHGCPGAYGEVRGQPGLPGRV